MVAIIYGTIHAGCMFYNKTSNVDLSLCAPKTYTYAVSPQEFKRELYQKKIEIESLNHRFVCWLSPGSERPGSVSPLCDFRQRWDSLESETVGRQVRSYRYFPQN